ncbi:MAG: DUF2341 domain-containing protein, partial [Phyllobacteriaceae bacterium]|nr:DUF2341 domain-containing protein [Phyllobacteriaceae bacterium]
MAFNPTGWADYKVVTVANSGAAVTGYQQVLQLLSVDVAFALWRSDGHDIRITTADGVTELPYWRRTWDSTNSIGELWFKCDLGAAGNTTFRLYYGNAGASDASSYDSTMQKLDTDGGTALALYHFDEGTGTPVDTTGNTTATLIGAGAWVGSDIGGWGPKQSQNFASGNALDCSGTNKAIKFANLLDTYGSAYSIEFVFKWPASPPVSNPRICMKYNTAGAAYNGIDLYLESSSGKLTFRTVYNTGASDVVHDAKSVTGESGLSTFKSGQVYRVVIQQSSTLGKELWINAALEAKYDAATTLPQNGSVGPFVLGAYDEGTGTSNYSNIQLDEFRVLNRWQTRDEIVCNWTRRKYFSGISTQQGRLTRSGSNPILEGAGGSAWDKDMAQEPVPYTDGTTWDLWYSGINNADPRSPIGLAQRANTSPEGSFTRNGSTPKLGLGNGGVTDSACHAGVFFEAGTWHLFYSDDITATANLRRATTTDKTTFTAVGVAIAHNQETTALGYANPQIVKAGSTYHMMCEGRSADGTKWILQHFTNTSITNDGGWVRSAAGVLNSLEYFEGHSFSHLSPFPVNGKWHGWYHTNTTDLVTPSVIVHAVSADLDYWLPDIGSGPVLDHCKDGLTVGGYQVDQIADAKMIESGGNTYLFYDVSANSAGVYAKICVSTYDGTVQQFVEGDNPRVSSVGNAGAQVITPSLHTNGHAFYAPTIIASNGISASLHTNVQSFFTPALTASTGLVASLYTGAQSFFAPTVSIAGGPQQLTANRIDNASVFYSPLLAPGAVSLAPSAYSNTQTFYNLTLTTSKTLANTLFANSSALYEPIVSLGSGPQVVSPSLFSNTQSFFTQVVTPGAVSLFPVLLTSSHAFYPAAVSSGSVSGSLSDADVARIAAAVLAALNATTGARTVGQHLQIQTAVLAGNETGAGTTHVTFTDGTAVVEADVPLPGAIG